MPTVVAIQGSGNDFLSGGVPVHDFDEYTFRAPRPGHFVGDSPTARLHNSSHQQDIPNFPTPGNEKALDRLSALPTELLCEILLNLDICSLLSLRRTHPRLKNAIEDWPSFRTMAAFPKLLSAAEALQCRSWTIESLLRSIHDERCSLCGHFGDLMYLVTPERWCYRCFITDMTLGVQRVEEDQVDTRLVPHVRPVPGHYGCLNAGTLKEAQVHVACDQRALLRLHPEAEEWSEPEVERDHPLRYATLICAEPDVERHHPLRYATVIRAPYWDASTLRFEEGVCCRACAAQGWLHRKHEGSGLALIYNYPYPIWGIPYRRYSRRGMREHLEHYGAIVKIRGFDGEIRYVHEKPTEQEVWDEPPELSSIHPLLLRCWRKEIEFPAGQPFLPGWDHVSSASHWRLRRPSSSRRRTTALGRRS